MMEKVKLDDYHYHEVVDRSFVYMDGFYEYVEQHPAVQANPELKEKSEEIMDLMYKFYSLSAVYADKTLGAEEDIKRATEYEYDEEE